MALDIRLREALKSAGMTQTELAARLGVTSKAVSAWARGRNEPTIKCLRQICTILGVRIETMVAEKKSAKRAA